MMKDVLISMHSVQNFGQPDEDSMDFTTDGHYIYEEGIGCLSYLESEVTGLDGTRTSVMVTPEQVVVDRDGNVTSRMVFQEGIKNSFQYSTPYGAATMGIDTRRIKQFFDENGGNVEIEYVIDMDHVVVTMNKFHIKVQEIGETRNG